MLGLRLESTLLTIPTPLVTVYPQEYALISPGLSVYFTCTTNV